MKKASILQSAVFLLFIAAFFILHLILPDNSFSERENRVLQPLPRFSWSALQSGRFTSMLESYCSDQFPLRDGWITLKAGSELALGKEENNGVCLCAGDTLIEPWTAPSSDTPEARMAAVNALAENSGLPVTFALIPDASELWREKLPFGVPNDSQADYVRAAYALSAVPTADVLGALEAHRDEPIFYRTDHHWTTLGAYYGYTAVAKALGLSPVPLSDYRETVVTREFYGTAYSSSGFSWVQPDSISAYVPDDGLTVTNYPAGQPEPGTLYEESRLAVKDKYAYFYGGNTPRIEIETGRDGQKLLILRDSYTDSLSPFLLAHYSRITMLDLRYYKLGLRDFLAEHDFDQILICYGVKSFAEDAQVPAMAE